MFAQSMTAHFLRYLKNCASDSVLVGLIIKLFCRLRNDFETSRLMKILSAFVSFIKRQYEVSYLKSFVESDGIIDRMYKSSLLCLAVCFVFNLYSKIAGKIWSVFERMVSGGIVHGFLSSLASKKIFAFHNLFAIAMGVMIVAPHELWNNLYALILATGFGTWFLIRLYKGKETAGFEKIHFGLVMFMVFATVISLISSAKGDAIRIMMFLYSAVVFCLLMGKLGDTKEKLMQMLSVICTAGAVTAVIGIIQRIIGVEVNPEYVDIATSGNMPGRVYSTFANPNNFAELLLLVMPLTLSMIFNVSDRRSKYFWGVCFAFDLVALGMSYSRSCWVGLALALVFMIIVYDWKLLVPLAFVAIAMVPFLPETILNRILSIGSMADSSNSYRLHIWNGAVEVIRHYFVSGLGAGPANFKIFYRPLADFASVTAAHSHMIYMELVIEFGIFGALGFFAYFVSLMKKGFAAFSGSGKNEKMLVAAAVGSMIGMLFVCMAEYVWFYPRDMFVFWLILGALVATTSVAVKSRKN